MKISQICIRRPVFATVLSLILVIIGLIAYMELPVRFAPLYFKPTLMVQDFMPGTSPEYVEQNLTEPLEETLASTPGMDYMGSRSEQGMSTIFLQFNNLTQEKFIIAQSQVLQEISGANLPENGDHPQIFQHGDSNLVMMLGFSDTQMPMVELVNYVNTVFLPRLQEISGVANVSVDADTPTLRVNLIPQSMAALNISVNDVQSALENSNTSYPLGSVTTGQQTLQVNSQMTVPDLNSFSNLVVAKKGARLVHLSDIAALDIGWEGNNNWFGYVNGQPGFMIEIQATDDANPIAVGQGIRQLVKEMQPNLPEGMAVVPVFDLSQPLDQAIHEVYASIFIAILLVILVTLGFLGNWRATLIPIVTIPICLIATFSLIFALGFSINVMTLLALVLAVGMVVDDAIVVMENTYRHIEMGKSPLKAAKESIEEISFAILGITVCLIAVYIPTIFMKANIDTAYFQEFSLSLASAILISGFLALTLSPMMCSRFLRPHRMNAHELRLQVLTSKVHFYYAQALDWVLAHRKTVFGFMLANIIFGMAFFHLLPTDLLPKSEINYLFAYLSGPNSASPDYMNQLSAPLRDALNQDSRLKSVMYYVNESGNVIFLAGVKDAHQRDQIATDYNLKISAIPALSGGVAVMDANQNQSSSHQGALYFYLSGQMSYQQIASATAAMQAALEKVPGITSVVNMTRFNQQQYNLEVNRNLARQLGVDLGVLNNTLSTFLGGYTFADTTYQINGYGYGITMQLPESDLVDMGVLQKLYVANSQNQLIPISSLVTVTPSLDLPSRVHVNQLRAGEVDLNIASNYSMGQAMAQIQATAAQVLPHNIEITWAGQMRNLMQNSASGNAFIMLGLVFIYLVLAAIFESFFDPLIILCTVPLCIVAGLLALYLVNGSINIYTKIALVTLIGLVSKHGVLITQFANQLRSEGKDVVTAVKEAALIRLRPILMTSLTMILGALPLILTTGTDASGRRQIGMIIVFGLLVGTIFSLFIVPVAYTLMARFKSRFNPKKAVESAFAI
ncbi:MAG: efflux RND transporter permease subunit [Gammaproteobacteria bacterium]|nr:efflux RND transporter permease subunit [Gammaproteobacteria bacterium]